MQNWFLCASNCSKRLSSATNSAFSVQHACGLLTTPLFSMLMRLRMLKLSVGKGRQVMKQLCLRVLQYYATVATELERAGYACALQSSSCTCVPSELQTTVLLIWHEREREREREMAVGEGENFFAFG